MHALTITLGSNEVGCSQSLPPLKSESGRDRSDSQPRVSGLAGRRWLWVVVAACQVSRCDGTDWAGDGRDVTSTRLLQLDKQDRFERQEGALLVLCPSAGRVGSSG